jgi:hypothetical protein
MTALSDVRSWLDTPGGHVFQASCGGYQQALTAIVAAEQGRQQAAYDLNAERLRNGLPALPLDAARLAVTPRGGPEVSGDTAGVVRVLSADPAWRVRLGSEEPVTDSPLRLLASGRMEG